MMFDPPQSTCMCIRNKGDKNNNKEQLDISTNYNISPQQNTRPLTMVQQKHDQHDQHDQHEGSEVDYSIYFLLF